MRSAKCTEVHINEEQNLLILAHQYLDVTPALDHMYSRSTWGGVFAMTATKVHSWHGGRLCDHTHAAGRAVFACTDEPCKAREPSLHSGPVMENMYGYSWTICCVYTL